MTTKQKLILIVDDDEDILKILNKILTGAGFLVKMALSPEEGRRLMSIEPPHLIISDLNMEPENGYKFIHSIRQLKQFDKIPIIVLSAVNDFNSVKKVIALGINDYAIKPLQAAMILRKVRKSLLNKEFASWNVPQDQTIELEVQIEAEVIGLGETGYSLSGPFKMTPDTDLKIQVPEFESLNLHRYIQRTSNRLKEYVSAGSFSNDVTFIAIDEAGSSSIRKYITKNGH